MILGFLQARTASSRLPGKVLLPLLGEPMLSRQIERLKRARSIDQLIVATSLDRADDEIAAVASEAGLGCYRGSAGDVLDRCYQVARESSPSYVVRLTADCPLADWDLIDRATGFAHEGRYDYVSTALRPTWPDGLDVEVVAYPALETAWREAQSPVEREHVTYFIRTRPERFYLGSVDNAFDLSAMRWTVDEPADFEFVRQVYEALYPTNPAFTTAEILKLLQKRPELMQINQGIDRNEGLRRSIEKYLKESAVE